MKTRNPPPRPGPLPEADDALLEFVLRNIRIRTNLCSRQAHENGYRLLPRTVADYNIIYVTRGRVVWVIEDQPYEMHPGQMVFVPPGVPHHGHSLTKRMALGSVHTEATLPGGQDVFELLIPPRFQSVPQGSRLDDYLRGFMAEFDRPAAAHTQQMTPGWTRLIVLELLRHDAQAGLLGRRAVDPLVAAVLQELARRLQEPLTLNDLAAWSGFSPQHLNRVFGQVLGVTPLRYLTRIRLEKAASLLADGRLTVRAIAAAVGIDDPYYFSRLFKERYGQSPARYRQAAGSDSPSPDSSDPLPR